MFNVNPIQKKFSELLPARRKNGTGGKVSINGPCCIHNNETADKRHRGGVKFLPNGGIIYHCFNCKYKTKYNPGDNFPKKFKKLCKWMGASDMQIMQMHLVAINLKTKSISENVNETPIFITLPNEAKPIGSWVNIHIPNDLSNVINYLYNERGISLDTINNLYWSPSKEGTLNERVILPIKYQGLLLGWTARYCGNNKEILRYLANIPQNVMFNMDILDYSWRKYIILVEGPFDAIAVNGIGLMGNTINKDKIEVLKKTGKKIIFLPDREENAKVMVNTALENDWLVSFPEWDKDIKDAADAARRYGRIEATRNIINSATNNVVKVNFGMNAWFKGD